MLIIAFQEVSPITPKVVYPFIKTVHNKIKHEKEGIKSGNYSNEIKQTTISQDRVEKNGKRAVSFTIKQSNAFAKNC